MDGVFQSVGQDDGQLALIHWERVGQGDLCAYPDPLTFGLGKVGGKHGVQHRRTAPADFFLLVQPLTGGIQEFQRCLPVAPGHQFCDGLKLMSQVVTLDSDAILHFFDPIHFFFQR